MIITDYSKAPSTYTPTPANTVPTFGQSGDAVLALQKSINAKNAGTTGYVPLVEDGEYGPKTYAAAQANSNLITTSGPTQTTFNNNSNALADAEAKLGITGTPTTTPTTTGTGSTTTDATGGTTIPDVSTTDPILTGLDSLKTSNDNATNALINSTKASYSTKLGTLDKEFENYKGGLQLLGIQTNQAQATPDLLLGHVHQAALDQMDKVNALKAEEAKVIMDAKTAQANDDFKTLEDKTTRLKQIQDEKNTAIQNVYTTVSNQTNVAKVEAHDIYDTMQTLDDADKESFLQAVATKFNIPVTTLVTAVADEKASRDKASATADPILSPTEAASLGVPYGTTKSQAAAKNITPTKGSSTSTDKENVAQTKNILKTGKDANGNPVLGPDGKPAGAQGADGFYDPYLYIKIFNAFNGTPKEFVSTYPIVGSINPASYNILPEALQALLPKKSSSSSSSSGRSTTGK